MSELYEVVSARRGPAQRLLAVAREYAVTLTVAIIVFLVAYDNGGFGESSRDTLAIVLWWMLILCVALGVWPLARTPLAAWLTGGLLAAFGLWTLLSVLWAANAAGAYGEFTRVMLYVAVFGVVVAGSRRDNAGRWLDGLALGIAGVAGLALISRFFPGTLEQRDIAQLLVGTVSRLSFPVGYWNGLATLVALGIPLLLRGAITGRHVAFRALAVMPIPAICGVIYLASARIGVLSAVVATVAFLLLAPRRWNVLGAVVCSGAGGVAVVLALNHRNALVNGPLTSSLAESQGRSAALIVIGLCVLTGLLYGVGCQALEGEVRPPPALGWGVLVAAMAVSVAGLSAAHPMRKFEEFKDPHIFLSDRSAIEQHLLSSSGNGRWQLWSSALDEFETRPLHGRGAGSFQAWWTQNGPLPLVVQDAHSLYAETLGELGVVGFVLLMGAFASALVVGVLRLRRVSDQRAVIAAAGSVVLVFLTAAAFDWVWELTIVGVVAFACLGLLVGPGTMMVSPPRVAQGTDRVRRPLARYGLRVAVVLAGGLVVCAIAIPLLAGARINASQDAAAQRDYSKAVSDARAARSIQPWSAAPYQQLALVEELRGNYGVALVWMRRALRRNDADWRLWLIKARLQGELGHLRASSASLARVRALYPRFRLFER
jgi:O-antigen ligase